MQKNDDHHLSTHSQDEEYSHEFGINHSVFELDLKAIDMFKKYLKKKKEQLTEKSLPLDDEEN